MSQTPCPYCGQPHDSANVARCDHCNGLFEPLSQTATQLAMGPWYVRDEDRPFMPGFNETILRQQVVAGRITANTIVRGPTTNQFWMNAADAPGVSRLMGTCHACHQAVDPKDTTCQFCKADMSLPDDVDSLGLRYTTDQQRAEAQKQIAEGRATAEPEPAAKPKPKPMPASQKPKQPAPAATPAPKSPEQRQPDTQQASPSSPPAPAEPEAPNVDGNELTSELAEDVWHSGAASGTRRRKRSKGPDPVVLGMGVMLLCVIALGLMIVLTSGSEPTDDGEEAVVEQAEPKRDIVAVSRISVPALTAYERLVPEEIPAEFEDRYAKIDRLKKRADEHKASENYDAAYEAYQELGELVTPLENDIAQWRVKQQAKAEAAEVRDRIARLRRQAEEAEAKKWAGKTWQEAQRTAAQADELFAADQFVDAGDLYTQAESSFITAENKALAGQVAGQARQALMDAMKAGGSEQMLRKYASEQIDEMLRLRAEADGLLNDQEYAKAEQSYNSALDMLNQAQQLVELSRYKKYYAFEAGFQASALMLAAARGDGVDATAQSALEQLFEKLRILPNPAAGITPGDDVGFTVAIQPLVNDARDKLIEQHGEDVQASYLIGFHASIIDQTLKTVALTDDQQKRIHQSLGTIESAALQAGWDLNQLRPVIDQVRTANRNADLNEPPADTRIAWKRLVRPMQSKQQAARLMNPGDTLGGPDDPELFPTNGGA